MKLTVFITTLLLLTHAAVSPRPASAQNGKSAAVETAIAANPVASKHTTDVPMRRRPFGPAIGLVALFGALTGLGLFVALTARRDPEES